MTKKSYKLDKIINIPFVLPIYLCNKIIIYRKNQIDFDSGIILRPTTNTYKYIPQISAKDNLKYKTRGVYKHIFDFNEVESVAVVFRLMNSYTYYGQFNSGKYFVFDWYDFGMPILKCSDKWSDFSNKAFEQYKQFREYFGDRDLTWYEM